MLNDQAQCSSYIQYTILCLASFFMAKTSKHKPKHKHIGLYQQLSVGTGHRQQAQNAVKLRAVRSDMQMQKRLVSGVASVPCFKGTSRLKVFHKDTTWKV